MRRGGSPCALCGNLGRTVRYRCACGGRHVVCAMCVIVQKLIDTEGPDSDDLQTCPDALKVADALMSEETIGKPPPDDGHTHAMAPLPANQLMGNVLPPVKVLPTTAAQGDTRFRETDDTLHTYDKGQWVMISAAKP